MQVFINSRPDIDAGIGVAAALGTFDGMHLGHRVLIDELKRIAVSNNLKTLVYTFTSIPAELFYKKNEPIRLFTLEEKIEAFEKTGIDYLVLTDFNRRYAEMSADSFIRQFLNTADIRYLVVGYNFTYGKQAKGNEASLKEEAVKYRFTADIIEPVMYKGQPVSSSRIRECLSGGDVELAAELLGYPYAVSGTVLQGRQIGRTIGFPTVNIGYDKEKVLPARGVYIARVKIGGRYYGSIANVGVNPTVTESGVLTLEAHVLDYKNDVYGEKVEIVFLKRLRDEIKFVNKEMLKEQLQKDLSVAATYFKI